MSTTGDQHHGRLSFCSPQFAAHDGIVLTEGDLIPSSAGEDFLPDLTDFVAVSDTKGYVLFAPDFGTNLIRPVTLP